MKEIVKNGVFLWLRTIVVTLMCFVICLSMSSLLGVVFSKEVGYDVYGQKEGEEAKLLYTYMYADGQEDTQKQQYEDEGYTVVTQKRNRMTEIGNVVFLVVTQLFCTILSLTFVYPNLWRMGAKDSNLVRYKHKKPDPFKGLKIGIVSALPSMLLYVGFIVCKFVSPTLPVVVYRFLNCINYSFVYVICREAPEKTVLVGDLAAWQFVLLFLPLLIIPAVAYGAYLLGFKDISLGEKFMYKKAQ